MASPSISTDKLALLTEVASRFISEGYTSEVKELTCQVSWTSIESPDRRDYVVLPNVNLRIVMKDGTETNNTDVSEN